MKTRKQSYNPDKHLIGTYIDWDTYDGRTGDFIAYLVDKETGETERFELPQHQQKLCNCIDYLSKRWHDLLGYKKYWEDSEYNEEEMVRQLIKVYECLPNTPELVLVSTGEVGKDEGGPMEIRKEAHDPEKHVIGTYVDWKINSDRRSDFIAYSLNRDRSEGTLFKSGGKFIKLSCFIDMISEEWHNELGYSYRINEEIVEQMDKHLIKVYEIRQNTRYDTLEFCVVAAGRPGYNKKQ